jgi:hypothetical protein
MAKCKIGFTKILRILLSSLVIVSLSHIGSLKGQGGSPKDHILITQKQSSPLMSNKFIYLLATNTDHARGIHFSIATNIATNKGGHFVRPASGDVPPGKTVQIDNIPMPVGYRILGIEIVSANY